MKKLRQKALLIVLIALLLIPALFVTVTTLANNHTENQFAQQLFGIKLPDHTSKVLEIHCRAGDKEAQKTQYWAVLLIRSDLDYQAIQEFYSKNKFVTIRDENPVDVWVTQMDNKTDVMFMKAADNLPHHHFEEKIRYKTYYQIVITDVSEFSLFDLPGLLIHNQFTRQKD